MEIDEEIEANEWESKQINAALVQKANFNTKIQVRVEHIPEVKNLDLEMEAEIDSLVGQFEAEFSLKQNDYEEHI